MTNAETPSAERDRKIGRRSERRKLVAMVETSNRLRYEHLQHVLKDELPFLLGDRQSAARVSQALEQFRLDILENAIDEQSIGPRTNRKLLGMDAELGHQAWNSLQENESGTVGLESMMQDPDAAVQTGQRRDITAGYALSDQRELLGKTGVLAVQSIGTVSSGIMTTLADILTRAIKIHKMQSNGEKTGELLDAFDGLLERTKSAIRQILAAQ